LAGSIRGYFFKNLNLLQQLVVFAGGLLFIAPGVTMPLVGLAAVAVALTPNFIRLYEL